MLRPAPIWPTIMPTVTLRRVCRVAADHGGILRYSPKVAYFFLLAMVKRRTLKISQFSLFGGNGDFSW